MKGQCMDMIRKSRNREVGRMVEGDEGRTSWLNLSFSLREIQVFVYKWILNAAPRRKVCRLG